MHASAARRLTRSFALSVLLHGWVLWYWPPPLTIDSKDLPPLQARLRAASPPADDSGSSSQRVATPTERASLPLAPPSTAGADRHAGRSRQFPAAAKELAAMTTVAPPRAVDDSVTSKNADTVANAMPTAPQLPAAATGEDTAAWPAAPAIAGAAPPAETGDRAQAAHEGSTPAPAERAAADIDADNLRAYRLALAREARRFRRYPALAREAGWHGRTTLRLELAMTPTLTVARGSGHAVLDQAALAMMQQAIARVPIPETLRARAASLELTIEFDLTQP